jgi:predicted nuclease of predicted toxin-antitoxin system
MSEERIKFLVDVGVGRKVESWLAENGYDSKAVRDLNPRLADREILRIAAAETRMVITMDKDFGELVYRSGLPHAGVLLLRFEDATSDDKTRIVAEILAKYEGKLMDGFCVFQNGRLRIRKD